MPIVNGTTYPEETPVVVINILEQARREHYRIRVAYGDSNTGRDWQESFDVEGYVSHSCGPVQKIPILIYNSRSTGGYGMLVNCIVKIWRARGKQVLYQHPLYHRSRI